MTLRRTVAGLLGALLLSPLLAQAQNTPPPPPPPAEDEWESFKKPAGNGTTPSTSATTSNPSTSPNSTTAPSNTTTPASTTSSSSSPNNLAPSSKTASPTSANGTSNTAGETTVPGSVPGGVSSSGPATTRTLEASPVQPTETTPKSTPGNGRDKAAGVPADAKVVSTKESFLPDENEHSPATMNNDLFDIRNSRDTAGINGQVGLFNVDSADFGHAGVLHFSVLGEYFKSNSFPVLDAADTRSAGTFALGYNFLEWLQAYVSYNVAANTNSRSSPRLIQDQGDATLGVAGGYEVYDGLYVGADLRLLIFPGVGNQDLSRSALGFAPKALVTYDVRRAAPKVPLRVHLNLGGVIDKTSELGQGHTLTASEEFALDVNTYNRFTVGAALESPLPVVTPFVEYDLGVPLGTGNLVAPDNSSVSVGEVMAQQIGVGVRVTAIKDVTLNLGVNIGLARTVAYGVPATMPWNFLFGLAYNIDPSGFTRTKVVERTFERKAPPPAIAAPVEAPPSTGKVEGFALDANTGKPIPGVMVALANSDLPPVATDVARGRFLTYDLPAGPVKLEAEAPGYHPATADATIEVGKTVPVEIKLVRELKGGTLNVNVSSKKKPVQAVLTVTGASNTTIQVNGDGQSQLPPGHYAVAVAADGYDPDSKEIDIESEKTANLKFDLKKTKGEEAAAPKLVVIIKNKIVIKQQVHFATNKAVILKDSFNLLNQVADVIKTNDLKKVEVAGHTDNVGPSDVNMKLSQDRADSVKAYLVKHGITEDKLEGKGYGDTKPIAPNMTAKGREQNRRVEFTIMER